MKMTSREIIKSNLGIKLSEDLKEICEKCNYHDRQKICQIHMIKTRNNDNCNWFKRRSKSTVYRGGGISPR
jgi:hypothetical protein